MAMLKMLVPNKKPYRAYLPDELLAEGFVGEVEVIAGAFTATMLKPGADLKQVKASLEIVLQDIKLRLKNEEEA